SGWGKFLTVQLNQPVTCLHSGCGSFRAIKHSRHKPLFAFTPDPDAGKWQWIGIHRIKAVLCVDCTVLNVFGGINKGMAGTEFRQQRIDACTDLSGGFITVHGFNCLCHFGIPAESVKPAIKKLLADHTEDDTGIGQRLATALRLCCEWQCTCDANQPQPSYLATAGKPALCTCHRVTS